MSVGTKKMMRAILSCLFLFASHSSADLTISSWTPLFTGVEHAVGWTDTPRLQCVNAIRIDLQHPGISFYTTPSNGSAPGDTDRQTGSQFMASSGVQIAVNAHFYNSSAEINWNADLMGLSVSNGQIVSSLENLHDRAYSLLITQDNEVRFEDTSTSSDLTGVWTAVESFAFFLINGVIVVDDNDPLAVNPHPRTAVGITYNQRYMILMTIDGRQAQSEGATFRETAEWLTRFGVYNGLNLDGGGSTHMLISNGSGAPITVNSPSENRAVGSHLGVYAVLLPQSAQYVYADFEGGNEGTLKYAPGYSGSTTGINETLSTAEPVSGEGYAGDWSQRIMIYEDTTGEGGWLVRHVSGSDASRSQNVIRPTNGYVGLFAKTTSAGTAISIAIDNTDDITADRGMFRPLIPDGQWHLYEWNLDDDSQWSGWNQGDGIIDTVDFTIDSIQIAGDGDAEIFIDHLSYSTVSLAYLFSMKGDYEPDGDVDLADLANFSADWLKTSNYNPLSNMAELENSMIDIHDLAIIAQNWQAAIDSL